MRNVTTSSDPQIWYLVVSWVLMIPLLCFASTGIPWFWNGGGGELTERFGVLASAETGTAATAAITILLFAIVSVLVFPWIKSVIQLCRRDKVFTAIAAWAILSCLWSQFPIVSLEWAPVAVLNIVFAFYLYRRFRPDQQIRLLLLLGWVCLVLSIVLALFFPRYGIYYGAWRGMYPQKNMCSMTTIFLLLPALYAPTTDLLSKVMRVAYMCLSGFLILMTQSATGRITLVCLVIYVVATRLVSRLDSRDSKHCTFDDGNDRVGNFRRRRF